MKPLNTLVKEKEDPLDVLIVGWNLEEIKKVFKNQSEINWKEREKDDEYWSGVVKKRDAKIRRLKKDASSLRGQVLSAIKRKNWWKNKSSQNVQSKKGLAYCACGKKLNQETYKCECGEEYEKSEFVQDANNKGELE